MVFVLITAIVRRVSEGSLHRHRFGLHDQQLMLKNAEQPLHILADLNYAAFIVGT